MSSSSLQPPPSSSSSRLPPDLPPDLLPPPDLPPDLLPPLPPAAPGVTLVLISDTHGLHSSLPPLPPGDVLIHAGDFTQFGKPEQIDSLMAWMGEQPHRHKILIAGNHDVSLDQIRNPTSSVTAREKVIQNEYGIRYLQDSQITLTFPDGEPDGSRSLTFWGSPWQPAYCDWAFQCKRGAEMAEKWQLIPTYPEIDVLITHGPPQGILDYVPYSHSFAGCEALLAELPRVKPRVHVFGHIHEGAGVFRAEAAAAAVAGPEMNPSEEAGLSGAANHNPSSIADPLPFTGRTLYCNASSCTVRYVATNAPIVVFVPFDKTADASCLSHKVSARPNPHPH